MPKIVHDGIEFDSAHEVAFYHWLEESQQHGLIDSFKTEMYTFELCESVKVDGKLILRSLNYTPDFSFIATELGKLVLPFVFSICDEITVDVKGSFNRHGGDRVLPIHQKMLYATHQVLVQKVVIKDLFNKTFCPDAERCSPKKKLPRKSYLESATVKEFIQWHTR